jgi:hypothetical protein
MRKLLAYSLIGALLGLVLIVAVVTVGCGTAPQSLAPAQPAPSTPQAILQQALANTGQVTTGTGDVKVSVTVNADQSKVPAGAQALIGQPITISGTYSFNKNPQQAQADLTASIAGQSIAAGLKAVNGQAWIQLMGQWYETPTAANNANKTTATGAQQPDLAGITQALAAAGVDPTAWLANLQLVGEDTTVGDTATYHLAASVNVSQIASDLAKLVQSGALKSIVPSTQESTESTAPGATPSVTMPSQQELQQLQSQLPAVFQTLTLDMWITKDTHQFRQVEVKATIVPPAETPQSQSTSTESTQALQGMVQGVAQGIKSIAVDATVSLTPASAPVTVTPPTNAKPWSDLGNALQGLTSLFSGFTGGGSTSTNAQ